MHAALKLQCGRVTGNKKSTIGDLIVRKNWSPSHSRTGSYGRPLGRQAISQAIRQTKLL